MAKQQTINLTNKPLQDFSPGDTLYVQKTVNDFLVTYFCRFVELRRGVVVAEVISSDPPPTHFSPSRRINAGAQITARASSCYLWGERDSDRGPRCHWFKGTDSRAE